MEEREGYGALETPAPPTPRNRIRTVVIVGAALALLLVTATAVTAATGWHFGRFQDDDASQEQALKQNPSRGPGGFPGIAGVVTAVDQSAKTITLAGVPSVTTVTVDASVTLTAEQADGTTKPATLGDFKAGQIVRVHGKIDRGQIQPGQRPNPANIKLTVTEIVLEQSGVVRGFGLVTAVSGNTATVVGMGGLSLAVTPAAGATLKKADGSTFAMTDVKVGDHLMFSGTQSGNAISASDLRLIPQGSFGPGGFGRGHGGFGPWHGGPGPNGPNPPGTPKPPSA